MGETFLISQRIEDRYVKARCMKRNIFIMFLEIISNYLKNIQSLKYMQRNLQIYFLTFS